MNYITAERVTKYIEDNLDVSSMFKVNHFGNLISLSCTDSLFYNNYCIIAYIECDSENIIINSNVQSWKDISKQFKELATEAIKLEKLFEKIRTNMIITTLNTYMKGVKEGFSVYFENNNICLDYHNRPCSSTDRFGTYINMDINGYKEGYSYLPKETNMFCAKYGELLHDIISDE